MKIADVKVNGRHRRDLGDIESLADSIKAIGLLHPIVVTEDGKLVAGARRLAAARILGWDEIPHRVVDSLDSARDLLIAERDENVCRLDFTPTEAVALGKQLEELERPAAKERQAHGMTAPGKNASVKFTEASNGSGQTRDKVGAALGMSGVTYEKARQVVEAAEQEPETFGDLPQKMDQKSIHAAHRELIHRQKKKDVPLPDGKHRVIYADPPWHYGNSGVIGETDNYGHVPRHYPSMTIKELCELPIADMAADDAVLFLWVTSPLLEECFDVIRAWGFKYKTSFVWDKVGHNFGHYNSVRHEFLLVCTRGSCTPDKRKLYDSVQSIEKSGRHSEKPEAFRDIIDDIYQWGDRIELFARTAADGWESWGNE